MSWLRIVLVLSDVAVVFLRWIVVWIPIGSFWAVGVLHSVIDMWSQCILFSTNSSILHSYNNCGNWIWGSVICIWYKTETIQLYSYVISSFSSCECARIRPNSGLFSVGIKVRVCCDVLLDPVNLWAPILWILLLYGSCATVETTARNGNSHWRFGGL